MNFNGTRCGRGVLHEGGVLMPAYARASSKASLSKIDSLLGRPRPRPRPRLRPRPSGAWRPLELADMALLRLCPTQLQAGLHLPTEKAAYTYHCLSLGALVGWLNGGSVAKVTFRMHGASDFSFLAAK